MTPSGETKTTTIDLNLTAKNPCVDQNFVTIQAQPLNALTYELESGAMTFAPHAEYIVNTVPITHTLCGTLDYTSTYDGSPINSPTDQPLGYNPASREFIANSEDPGLDDMTKPYTVDA